MITPGSILVVDFVTVILEVRRQWLMTTSATVLRGSSRRCHMVPWVLCFSEVVRTIS